MKTEVPVYLAGARGLLAGEFLRLLASHPSLRLAAAYSRGGDGALSDCHPQLTAADRLRGMEHLATDLSGALARGPAALVLALNHGESAPAWRELQSALGSAADRLTVIDLSADFRLPAAEEAAPWTYGLPELHPVPAGARRVAAAGCFATALQLAIVPAARAGLLAATQPWIAHGITGSSGSGAQAKPATHHPHRHDNLWAYAWDGHRHEQELGARRNFSAPPPLHFVACSGPFSRGIHLAVALPLARTTATADARAVYEQAFAQAACVRVLPDGPVQLRAVIGSNRADLSVGVRDDVLHVFCALDNTIKGGSGQALQCLNLALGLPETSGLPLAGLGF